MAKPLLLEFPPRNPRAELQAKLDAAPIEHAEALLSAYEVLQGLHESGALDILRGMAGARDKVVETLVDAIKSPDSVKAMRNGIILLQTLGSIDPEVLKAAVAPITKTAKAVSALANAVKKPKIGTGLVLTGIGLIALKALGARAARPRSQY